MTLSLLLDFLTYTLPSGFLSGITTWFITRRKRNNDLLAHMQQSIDLLCEKYNAVLQENVTLRQEKAGWQVLHEELLLKIDRLTREVATLRKNINRNTKAYESIQSEKTLRSPAANLADEHQLCHSETERTELSPRTKRTTTYRKKQSVGLAHLEPESTDTAERLLELHPDRSDGDDSPGTSTTRDPDSGVEETASGSEFSLS